MLDLWLKTVLYTGVTLNLTLPELGMLLNPVQERNIQRKAIMDKLPSDAVDIHARWQQLCDYAGKKPSDFEAQAGSTLRRLSGFLDNHRLRRIFGVPDASLDLAKAMGEGAVMIVDLSLGPNGRIASQDANTFGTLLLTDFFTQMQQRTNKKAFTLYIDEFQEYATDDIARMLDRARKRGLQCVLSHQRPGQFLDAGPDLQNLWSAITDCTRTKVVFGGIKKPDHLKEISSMLSMGMLDPYKIKDEIWVRKIMDYNKEYWDVHSEGYSHTSDPDPVVPLEPAVQAVL